MGKRVGVASELTPYIQCLVCGRRAYMEEWAPPSGLDPGLRKFVCIGAGDHHLIYYRRYIEDEIGRTEWNTPRNAP